MKIKMMGISLTLLGILALGSLLPTIGLMEKADAEWETQVFEEAIDIERNPDHIGGRAPLDKEPVGLTIYSKNGQYINSANVRYSWSFGGESSEWGGYEFTRINETAMEVDVQGYPGGYTIQYQITAYDEKNVALTSSIYSYTVVKNGSFQGDDFENNIVLEWGPMTPEEGETVSVSVDSRDPTVPLKNAYFRFDVNVPDQPPVEGGVLYFERVNQTSMTLEVIPYPPGSRIGFFVEVYDKYDKKLTSRTYNYEYPTPPPTEPVYEGNIYVVLIDESMNNGIPKNAVVTFSNRTYSYTMEAVNGWAITNRSVNQGDYDITIDYEGEVTIEKVTVGDDEGFTFRFIIKEQDFEVEGEEERPHVRELIGLLIILGFTGAAFYGAARIKEARESLNIKRKKARKRSQEQELNYLEKLLKDEDLKGKVIRVGAFALLSLLGIFWAPFYPWWMALIIAAFLTAISIKYPYISMLIMAVLVSAAAAYQSREFGWVFLIFSLLVMVGGFFDWKFAYLTYLTIFAAGYGVGFAIPLVAALAFSLFMGTVVLLAAGLFLLVISPSGNFQWFSLIATPRSDKSFVRFDRAADPEWSPVDVANELGDLTYVDTGLISSVLSDTMTSLQPLVVLLGWGIAMLAAYLIFIQLIKGNESETKDAMYWGFRLIPGLILVIFGIVAVIWSKTDLTPWLLIGLASTIPASLLAFGVRKAGEEALPTEYGVEEVRSSDVGKKISEMVGFRKASFKDIGGLEDVKREVKNALMVPLLEPEMATKYGVKPSKGVLLFGPPGCGKTLMLRAVASDLNVDMIGIKCSDVMSKWYGESENLIAGLFEEARARSPCILFLDEIDSIAKRRDFYSTDDVTPRVLSIMLSEMDGMDEAEGVIIVATTNMPDLVDPALMRPGRFDKVIYVPPPDAVSREEILKIHIKGKFASEDIDMEKIASKTKGFSGADLANLVREASSMGLERALETKKPQPITMEDMEEVLKEIKPSVTPKMIKMYDKLRKEYERKKRGGRNNRGNKGKKGSPEKGGGKQNSKNNKGKILDMSDTSTVVDLGKEKKGVPGSAKDDENDELDEIEKEIEELTDWEEA